MRVSRTKALSLKQPWANLIVDRIKNIETRKWRTRFRGRFFIHASKSVDKGISGKTKPRGCLIGIATLTDVRQYNNEFEFILDERHHRVHWLPDKYPVYGFLLEDIEAIKPIPFKGMLNFFETGVEENDPIIEKVRERTNTTL